MSIRLRLLVSYLAMLFIPLVLFSLAVMLLLTVFKGDLKQIWSLTVNGNSAIWFDNSDESHTFHDLKRIVETNPDTLSDYLGRVDNELNQTHQGVVLRKAGKVIHVTASVIKPEVLQQLTEMKPEDPYDNENTVRIGSLIYEIHPLYFSFSDHSKGSLFFVREINPYIHFAQKFLPLLLIALLVILVLTQALLTYFVSRSIIRPLNRLKEASKQIKAGNLEFSLTNTSKDEIGQLSVAFEEMRVQLKGSIEMQLKYEENRKELLSNISHDLKTPITSIKGYATGIKEGIADTPEMMSKYIEIICSQAEAMDHLIDELFLFSKLDLKRMPFYYERVNIAVYLRDFLEGFRYDLEKDGFSIELDIQELDNEIFFVDREKFKRVLTNIINNSVKYNDKAIKHLAIKGSLTVENVVIEIVDNGCGIEPDAVPYIFDRFYRAEQSRNTATGGSGLGLAIAKQIVEGHNGEINVESTYGVGTTLFIRLPRSKVNDESFIQIAQVGDES